MGPSRRLNILSSSGSALSVHAARPGRTKFRTPLLIGGIAIMAYVIWTASVRPPRPISGPQDNAISGLLATTPSTPNAAATAASAAPNTKPNSKPDTKPENKPDARADNKPNLSLEPKNEAKPSPVPVELSAPRQRPQVGPGTTRIERSAETVVQWADKSDPGRVAGEFRYATLEPLEAKRYLVQSPRTWMYSKDGWSIYIQSDSGRVYVPDEQATRRPESGTLRGNVIIKAFKPRPDGSRPDPATDAAYFTARTDSLLFDGAVGELSTPDRIVAEWVQGSFAGRGLTAVYNELKGRVEFAEIREGEEIILRPSAREVAAASAAPASALNAAPQTSGSQAPVPLPPAASTAAPTTSSPASPATAAQNSAIPELQTLYRAVFSSDVHITQSQRTFTSDQLELWARLVNGRFATDAFGPRRKAALPAAATPAETPRVAATVPEPTPISAAAGTPAPAAQAPAANAAPAKVDPNTADIRITWSGPLQIRTSDTPFPELENDSVVAKFTSPRTGIVSGSDAETSTTIRAAFVEYFATRRAIHLEGPGASGVALSIENSGKLMASNLSADLLKGSAHIAGSGSLDGVAGLGLGSTSAPSKASPNIEWTQAADFAFDQSGSSPRLREAIFTGDVRAKDQASQLRADFARAEFAAGASDSNPILTRLTLQNHASATDPAGGMISADHIDASFITVASNRASLVPAIDTVIARGDVTARRAAQSIQSGYLEAHFVTEPGKSPIASTLLARDDVRLVADNDMKASANELKAVVATSNLDLTGTAAAPAQASKGPTRISGVLMHMDGLARTLTVNGAGHLDHSEVSKNVAVQDSRVSASWTTSLVFDDRLGKAQLVGDVQTTWLADPLSTDLLKSHALALDFTPYTDSLAGTAPKTESAARELLKVLAVGDAASPATLESRRYSTPATNNVPERSPDRITYLEGQRILADNSKGTLDVPGAGKLLVSDRRPGAASRGPNSFGGDALFHWTDSLAVRRAAETADMSGNVEVIHLRPGDDAPTELHAQKVSSVFRRPANVPGPATQSGTRDAELAARGEIVHLNASGAVWARSSTKREINADFMDYDAINGMIVLTAEGDREIQAFDPATSTPVRGKALEWDLKKDRIRLKDLGGITAPR